MDDTESLGKAIATLESVGRICAPPGKWRVDAARTAVYSAYRGDPARSLLSKFTPERLGGIFSRPSGDDWTLCRELRQEPWFALRREKNAEPYGLLYAGGAIPSGRSPAELVLQDWRVRDSWHPGGSLFLSATVWDVALGLEIGIPVVPAWGLVGAEGPVLDRLRAAMGWSNEATLDTWLRDSQPNQGSDKEGETRQTDQCGDADLMARQPTAAVAGSSTVSHPDATDVANHYRGGVGGNLVLLDFDLATCRCRSFPLLGQLRQWLTSLQRTLRLDFDFSVLRPTGSELKQLAETVAVGNTADVRERLLELADDAELVTPPPEAPPKRRMVLPPSPSERRAQRRRDRIQLIKKAFQAARQRILAALSPARPGDPHLVTRLLYWIASEKFEAKLVAVAETENVDDGTWDQLWTMWRRAPKKGKR